MAGEKWMVFVVFLLNGIGAVVTLLGNECPYTLETRSSAPDFYTIPVDVGNSGLRQTLRFSVRGCGQVALRLTADPQTPGPSDNFVLITLDDSSGASTLANVTDTLATYSGGPQLWNCTGFHSFALLYNIGIVALVKGSDQSSNFQPFLQASDPSDFSSSLVFRYASVRSLVGTHYWNFGQQGGQQGLYLNAGNGTVTSPDYRQASPYPPDVHCQWVIATLMPPPTSFLVLQLLHVQLEDPGSTGACLDKVTVRRIVTDSPDHVYCGDVARPDYRPGNSSIVHLAFTSSSNQSQRRGFAVQFYTAYSKIITYFRVEQGQLFTPSYPDRYPPYADIVWVIFIDAKYSVALTFRDFDLEDAGSNGTCSSDVVVAFAGNPVPDAPVLGRFCGKGLPPVLNSGNASLLYIKMTSDDVTNGRGFVADFSIGGCTAVDKYGTNCSQPCLCNVSNTESCAFSDGSCACRAGWRGVTCDDDIDECVTAPVMTCEAERECVNTPGSAACRCLPRIYAEVDGTCQRRCGGNLTGTDGSFSSPGFGLSGGYPLDVECTWTIRAQPGFRVALSFRSLHTGFGGAAGAGGCGPDGDFVRVSSVSGLTNNTRFLCGVVPPQTSLESQSNSMEVHFSSDNQTTFPGFFASYKIVPECGGNLTGEMNGSLTSPELLGGGYPPNSACAWTVTLPSSGFRVALTFTLFDIEDGSSDGTCSSDAVEVLSGGSGQLLQSFCGKSLPPIVTSSSNSVRVVFRSDSSKNFRGFKAFFAPNGCVDMVFGVTCNQSCSCNVTNTRLCDPVNGTCYCQAGWEGVTCQRDVDECRDASLHNCTGGNQQCQNAIGGFNCVCAPGFVAGVNGICQDIDECLGNGRCRPEQCTNTQGGYTCTCGDGSPVGSSGDCAGRSSPGETAALTVDTGVVVGMSVGVPLVIIVLAAVIFTVCVAIRANNRKRIAQDKGHNSPSDRDGTRSVEEESSGNTGITAFNPNTISSQAPFGVYQGNLKPGYYGFLGPADEMNYT